MTKIVHHACFVPMFTPPMIAFLNQRLPDVDHQFFVQGVPRAYLETAPPNVHAVAAPDAPELIRAAAEADRVVFNGIIDDRMPVVLSPFPHIVAKSIWLAWGGDLHWHEYHAAGRKRNIEQMFRAQFISRLYAVATPMSGDYELVQRWYPTGAKHITVPLVVFPFDRAELDGLVPDEGTRSAIQVGNSGNPSNEHLEVFDWIRRIADRELRVCCPLSYGRREYIHQVIRRGTELFGDRFAAITELLPPGAYNRHLANLDTLILNHRRQQGFGNVLIALYLGIKVYVRREVSTWRYLVDELGCRLFDTTSLAQFPESLLAPIDEAARAGNRARVSTFFDPEAQESMWRKMYEA
jgi:dTDP-N-acetylfucosamine:lipid II N-acetylfucosaminyltransferase